MSESGKSSPAFGIKEYKVHKDAYFWDHPKDTTPDEQPRDVLVVEFNNGRVYRSVWDNKYSGPDGKYIPVSRMATHRYADLHPLDEQEMEYMVVAYLTHCFFDPSHQDEKVALPGGGFNEGKYAAVWPVVKEVA